MKLIFKVVVLLLMYSHSYGQLSPKQKLITTIQNVQKLDKFSYTVEIQKLNAHQLYDTIKNSLTIDYSNEYYKVEDEDQIIVVNDKYVFDLNHLFKTIKVFHRKAYQKKYSGNVSNINHLFDKSASTKMIDSLLLKLDKVNYNLKDGIEHYSGQLTQGDMIFEISLLYNPVKKLPVQYSYQIFSTKLHKLPYLKFKANKYRDDITINDFSIENYIIYKDGKFKPLKHQQYKLITTL